MEQINLYEIVKFYTKKWRVIVSITLLGLLAGIVYNTFIQVPEYKSNSKLLLISSQNAQVAITNQTLINNYISLIKSHRVLDPVIEKQNKSISYDDLLKSIVVTNEKDTAFIDITVSTSSAVQSASVANETTDSFKKAASDLYQKDDVTTVDPAVKAVSPDNVRKALQLTITTVVGFIVSLIVVFINFDYRRNHPVKIKKKNLKTTKSKRNLFAFAQISKLSIQKPKPINKAIVKKPVAKKVPAKITVKKIKKTTTIPKPVTKKKASSNTRKS